MEERKHTTIQIAGQTFRIAESKESVGTLRKIEANVNKMWAKWCDDFRNQSQQEVLAMVAFQYARHYYKLKNTIDANEEAIMDFENKLDEILLNVK